MAMKSSPDRCLLCDDPWTGTEAHRSRGLHPRCYNQMRNAGRLDEFPILRYRRPARPPTVKEEVVCLTPDCGDTVMRWSNRLNKTYRCNRCQYVKTTTGGYDRRLTPRYDISLPLLDRVLYWLDPDTRQPLRGVPTPFVKPGGPAGDCLIWQRRLGGNPRQIADGSAYPKAHYNGKQERAHRLVYSAIYRVPLDELLVVDHSCEQKPCINPAHLGAETRSGNTAGRLKTLRLERLLDDPEALRARLAELEQAA